MKRNARQPRRLKVWTNACAEALERRELLASIAEFGTSPGAAPTSISSGADGNLWFTEEGRDSIGRITGNGVFTEFSLSAGSAPQGIAAGPDGNLWFTEAGTDMIGRISSSGVVTEFALAPGSSPRGITTGPDGNLWFAEFGTDKVASIVPSGFAAGTVTEFSLGSGSRPDGITTGPDGNVWFTEMGADKVANIVPSGTSAGTITEFAVSSGSGPKGITAGPDGNLWFAESLGNNIGQVTTGGSVLEFSIPSTANPDQIVSGPGGLLYYTESGADAIGSVSTVGNFAQYPTPTSPSGTAGIALGPDNHVWFAESAANQIGRLNLSPVALSDVLKAVENTTLTNNAATSVLANDYDPEGDPLTAVVVTNPLHGSLTLNADGSFTYVPDAGYHGLDNFTYNASDGFDSSNTATASIRVDAPPVAVDDSYTTVQNTGLTTDPSTGVLANDTDADGDPLTAVVVTNPAHGSLALSPDGSFTYVPNAGYHGPDSFSYKANDGIADSNAATVNIRVDAPPVAADDRYRTAENTGLTTDLSTGVLANDTDADGDPLTAVVVTNPAHGSLALSPDGSFTYVPNAGYHGPDSFSYKANDGIADSNAATVNIRVDAPPVAADDRYRTAENTGLTTDLSTGVLANDTDADGDPLTAVVVTNPAHGSLTLNADGSFTYLPAGNYYGPDSFSYKANDGIADSNAATVNIRVVAPPVAVDNSYSVNEDSSLTQGPAVGVLANDTDPNGNPLTAVLVNGPSHGSLALNPDGSFTYTPDALFFGSDSFTYKDNNGVSDGNVATVSLSVTHVNHAPVAVADSYSTLQPRTLLVSAPGLLGNDTDADGDLLTAVLVDGPAHGSLTLNADGSFTYVPDANFSGTDSFAYQADDGNALSHVATVTLNVAPDHAPVAVDDTASTLEETTLTVAAPGLLGNDTDADDDAMTAVLVSSPAHGHLDFHSDGSYTYTPGPLFHGIDGFTYRAYDGTFASNVATVTLNVAFVNHLPVATADAYSVAEDGVLSVAGPGVLGNDTDADGDPLSAVLVNGPAHGSLTLNADGSFNYRPNALYRGSDSFTYMPSDGMALGAIATVALTVTPVNHAPVGVADSATTAENVPLTIAAPGLLGNDTDADGGTITPVVVSGPAHGTLSLNPNGSYTYTPAANYNGQDGFTYRPYDGTTLGNLTTVLLTVTPVNQAPVVTVLPQAVVQGTALSGATVATFTDVDADQYVGSYAATIDWGDGTPTTQGTITRTGNSFVVTGSHVFDQAGSFVLRVTVTDPAGASTAGSASTAVGAIPARFALAGAINTGSNVGPTRNPSPIVTGTAPPGDLVTLYAAPSQLSATATQVVGQGVAGPDGTFRIASQPLADGIYTLSMTAVNPNAPGSALTFSSTLGTITVDTASPHIVALSLDPTLGRFYVTYQDVTSGMAQASILNPSNYVVARTMGSSSVLRNVAVTGVSLVSASNGTMTVAVTVNHGKAITRSKLIFGAYGRTITDAAGNQLEGNFGGNFPTGGDGAGSSFVARIDVKGGHATTSPQHVNFAPVLGAVQVSFNRSAKVAHRYGAAHPRARRHG